MTGRFEPIAIVGQSCVLPDALSPAALWENVLAGKSALRDVPDGRWSVRPELVRGRPGASDDATWSTVGGYVTGFERAFDPAGFALPVDEIAPLDPLFHWVLHAGREALRDAGLDVGAPRAGLVLGNLSFPSEAMARWGEAVYTARYAPDVGAAPAEPRDRFMSGLPAHLAARALRLDAGAFALDAACASSLYALRLAADALRDRRADVMLAGAVNRADSLFLHVGFCALQALSPTGRSRPFHKDADGLIPAEGCALLALMRLDDARRQGRRVLGVVRGVGLSNDGRGRNLLAPSSAGQARAMRHAYEMAGLSPRDVSLVECHATGTPTGDRAELHSLAAVFEDARGLPLGSLKSNLGHLITTAGAAGLMKVLGALAYKKRPPTLGCDEPVDELTDGRFRPLLAAEDWDHPDDSPRRAAVSAFGFGGNNAHVVVEEAREDAGPIAPLPAVPASRAVAIVGLGVRVGGARGPAELLTAVERGAPPLAEVEVDPAGLRFPPRDLEQALPQQLLVFEAARDAVAHSPAFPSERTGVLVGMGCDVDVTTPGIRWRVAEWADALPAEERAGWIDDTRAAVSERTTAQSVLGGMPNIPANRLNGQLDLRGPSFTVSAEELSGLAAVRAAATWLHDGELDACLVGAVDVPGDERHQRAAEAVAARPLGAACPAAVALVLKRVEDARRDGDPILAVVDVDDTEPASETVTAAALDDADAPEGLRLDRALGETHAASGLLAVAVAAARCARGASRVHVAASGLGGARDAATVRADDGGADLARFAPRPASERPLRVPLLRRFTPVAAPSASTQAMAPAPALPPPGSAPGGVAPRAHRPEPTPTVAEPSQPPPSRVHAPAAETAAGLSALAAARGDLARAHAAFAESLGQAHTAFLDARAQSYERVASALRRRGPATFVPKTPAATATAAAAVSPPAPVAAPTPVALPRVAAEPSVETPRAEAPGRPRPLLDRGDLERLASGRISEVLGPLFDRQDNFPRQVRMPEPPLLLADRVLRIDADAGVLAPGGTIYTETDVTWDSWYLHEGRVPPGVLIEAGQADLLLISWMGVDFENRGERVYRLLGCDLTYQHALPQVGDTIHYDIHVDGFATHGDVRIFFFHSDGRLGGPDGPVVLSVRNGQAGFFTDEELADSGGVLWTPADEDVAALQERPLAPPRVATTRRALSRPELVAWTEGDATACFGEGFELAATHVRTPAPQGGDMLLLDRVTELSPTGGPWERGYLRAELDLAPDHWFFDGHFKDDPCMPGTLMFEGCLQTLGVYLGALGFTLDKDGYRFEPVTGESYQLRCRGQAIPGSKQLVYEVFVKELTGGDEPVVVADILVTVDGLKSLHCREVALKLVVDHPLYARPALLGEAPKPDGRDAVGGVGRDDDDADFGQTALLATAWGRPSDAFGELYREFDGPRRMARLPGPPYHFMSRVRSIDGARGEMQAGQTAVVEYDVPPDAWFFDENGAPAMPFAILLEVALQPCGWLSSWVGSMKGERDLYYRNLDGEGVVHRTLDRTCGTLFTRAHMTSTATSGGMIIQKFDFAVEDAHGAVFDGNTAFGFFPPEALAHQVGVGTSDADRARLAEECPALPDGTPLPLDLGAHPARLFDGSARLARPMLRMIDELTALWPEGGSHGRGYARARKVVTPDEWFFRAHFFQDPVQPGSLGVEAMLQTLQAFMLEAGLCDGLEAPVFEPIAAGEALTWRYRGQVIPTCPEMFVEVDVTDVRRDDRRGVVEVEAGAWLWANGLRIYHAPRLVMRAASTR